MEQADLHRVFSELDTKLGHLTQRLESYRNYERNQETAAHRRTSKCVWICGQEQNPEVQARCLRQCQTPVVPFESIENMYKEFPVDVQRLREDYALRQHFERYQRSPDSMKETPEECEAILDIYAMPISVHTLPDEAWSKAMSIISHKKFAKHLSRLLDNWEGRRGDYPKLSQKELIRKLTRHDREGVIEAALQKRRRKEQERLGGTTKE